LAHFVGSFYLGKIGFMIRTPLTSTATSLTGFPASLSISSSQDLGKETALLVPTWIIFLIMGIRFSSSDFIRKLLI